MNTLSCPVCQYTEIVGNSCPNCDTDISLIRLLAELPPRTESKITIWQVGVLLLILIVGIGLGAISSFLFFLQPSPLLNSNTVIPPTSVVVTSKSKTPVISQKTNTASLAKPSHYVVKPGDSLSKIAAHFYKKNTWWTSLVKANPKLKGREDFIEVGEVLVIPSCEEANCGNL